MRSSKQNKNVLKGKLQIIRVPLQQKKHSNYPPPTNPNQPQPNNQPTNHYSTPHQIIIDLGG